MKKTIIAICLAAIAFDVAAQSLPSNPLAAQPGQYPAAAAPAAGMVNPYEAPAAPINGVAANSLVTATPPAAPPAALPPLPSAFDQSVERNMGVTPEEIRLLRRLLDERQRAAAEMPNPPKSVTGSVSVSMSPGTTPPVVRPFYGVSTSVVILDQTGAPWPVENFSVGNKALFAVERLDGPGGSTFTIAPTQQYGQSNLILKLAGANTPIVLTLVSGQSVHDARVEARVQGRGPNASVSSAALVQGVDSRLLSVLDGVPPQGRSVKVSGDQGLTKAWVMPNGRIWLRTPITVVSPAPIAFVSASDGTRVYELMPTARILGMANNQFITLEMDGCLQECATAKDAGW